MAKLNTYATLAAAGIAVDDLFPMTDTSASGAVKNVTAATLLQALLLNSSGFAAIGTANIASFGPNGATNPSFQVNGATASAATGWKSTGAAAAAGADLSVISSGTNENGTINAKGSGTLDLNPTGTGAVTTPRAFLSRSATGGIGYATGAGGAVTQTGSRTTAVVLNTITGAITLVSAAGSATPFSFTLTNSAIAATDVVIISQKSGTDKYTTQVVTAVGAGSCQITLANASGTTTEQPVFNFAVIKGVAS